MCGKWRDEAYSDLCWACWKAEKNARPKTAAQQRAFVSQERAHKEYRELLVQFAVKAEWGRWRKHLYELRLLAGAPTDGRRSQEFKAYWLERFTLDEIRVIGAAIESLLRDVEDPHCFLDARVARTEVAA